VHDLPDFFARLLAERLRAEGIEVGGHRAIGLDEPAVEGEDVAPVVRTPLATVLTRCNRDSQNLYAESLVKRAGHALSSGTQPGSWSNGAAAVRMVVSERLKDDTLVTDLVAVDGSGLSRDNRVTARLLTAWLDSFHRDSELGRVFIASLAVGGVSGTLDERFRDSRFVGVIVQAKSGYINQVSCLTGFVTAEDGRRRSFSILVNEFGAASVRAAKTLQDDVIAEIVEDLHSELAVEIGG
ncbi:MAG: D-alanyl-D-alanine carboxypeptidase/D-alanyl-D-alanine-endopeptidase, partial [Actinobacteria bacterium]|nr:D-alanyl-D-alanine carboxypeptidase/D-alanyl-D-alanine-endopeptidase [Actinomycetota bacterium]